MPGASKTSILIRVQARGGKFLADDIGGAEVTVRDAQTGEWLGGGLAQGTDSGNLSGELVPNASQSAVVTPATAGSQPWLLELPAPEWPPLREIRADRG
jgi:hypothetical protein